MNFLIQTINGKIVHDFSFELERSIEYQMWRGREDISAAYCELEQLSRLDFGVDSDAIRDYIPVGTVEFVTKFCKLYINPNAEQSIKPINIPEEMSSLLGRWVCNMEIKDGKPSISLPSRFFIKSNDRLKYPLNGIHSVDDLEKFDNGSYQVSDVLDDIQAEYRIIVYKDEILGIQFYSGDPEVFPNRTDIHNLMAVWNWNYGSGKAPVAHTLDVMVTEDGTFPIECHDFFSCGLYGFSDYNKLPFMFSQTFHRLKERLITLQYN